VKNSIKRITMFHNDPLASKLRDSKMNGSIFGGSQFNAAKLNALDKLINVRTPGKNETTISSRSGSQESDEDEDQKQIQKRGVVYLPQMHASFLNGVIPENEIKLDEKLEEVPEIQKYSPNRFKNNLIDSIMKQKMKATFTV